MALINCPECNKEVSDKSEVCVHCGFPIRKHIETEALRYDILKPAPISSDEIVKAEKWLLKEILGYTDDEIHHIIYTRSLYPEASNYNWQYTNCIASNLTAIQALKAAIPLNAYEANCFIVPHGDRSFKYILTKNMPHYEEFKHMIGVKLDHYYDEPVITEDQKADIYEKEPFNRCPPSISINETLLKCPTCGSTKVNKISAIDRGLSVGILGLFSKKINKSFECKNCGYTW